MTQTLTTRTCVVSENTRKRCRNGKEKILLQHQAEFNKGLKRGTEFSEGSKTSLPLVKGVAWGVAWDAPVRKGRRWMEGDGLGKEEQEEFQRVTHGRNSRSIKEPHLVSI